MTVSELIQPIKLFYIQHTSITIAMVAAMVILVIINPKQFGKIVGALAVLVTIIYVVVSLMNAVSKGIDNEADAGARTNKQYRDSGL